MNAKNFLMVSTALLGASLLAADDAKSRVDAFLSNEFADGALKCMSCAYEQHGETRYQFVAQKGWEGFDADTPLHVASITKVFTATLLMQLSEEGKISLNDYVKKYIPEFKGEYVPIINLMTHTSGWRNKTGHVAKCVDARRHQEFYDTMYQDFEVNEKFRYMSQGYDILAEICEKVTGVADVADLARDRIFRPLGMDHSAFAAHQGQSGLHITAPDLVKFGRHLLDIRRTRKNGILTPQGVDTLFRRCLKQEFNRTPAFFAKSGYIGFGQYFADVNTMDAVGHAGATGCFLLIDPGLDAVEVVLTNRLSENDTHFSSCDANFSRIFSIMATHFGDEPIGNRDEMKAGSFGLQIDRVKAAAESERVASKQARELGL
ncbi:MAG: beta-lactamase family protein [Kiritimatiellae bacterium]|nr:beta-lactamase family protein [Kiritimatiellia bacterium]